jgi:pyruvate dehydrogenase E2 component (dihydrolipoamide acetyltransferase)
MTHAVVIKWLKQPGERVAAGDLVVEIETDKATTELESEVDGVLGAHLHAEDDEVPVGETLVEILEDGATADLDGEGVHGQVAHDSAAAVESASAQGEIPAVSDTEHVLGPASAGPRERHRQTPRARRLAREQAAASQVASGPEASNGHRTLIAGKTTEAWQSIPHFSVTGEIDAEPLRTQLAQARKSYGRELTYTDLLLRAVAQALRDAEWAAEPAVGLAVATPRGVANPVLRDVLSLPFDELAQQRAALVERARAGRLTRDDIGSAATTLSNLGSSVVDHFTGIITPGQQSLITVGAIRERPVVTDGAVRACLTMFATVVVDHRALDGADAATLLGHLSEGLNQSERIAH